MGVNKDVFTSESERRNFYKLCQTWGDKYLIYHNLPFLNVFNSKNLIDWQNWKSPRFITLTKTENALLKKTSINYTLCDKQDIPILCIEFDGLQEGFNAGIEYFASGEVSYLDPWHEEIMDLKLKVAYGSMFPYFVVGSREFDNLSPDIKLTIVDGIIGEVLATKARTAKFSRGFDPTELGYSEEDFESLPKCKKDELVEDWALGVEIEAEMEHNPVARIRWEDESIESYSSKFLSYPTANNAKLNAAEVTLHTPDFGDIPATALIPNFEAVGFIGLSLVEDIALILASERLRQMRAH